MSGKTKNNPNLELIYYTSIRLGYKKKKKELTLHIFLPIEYYVERIKSSKPVGHLVINYSEGRLREAALSIAINMKLQLLVIACFIALSSALAAKGPSRLESGLSHSSRINNFGLTARDDDFYICFKKRCWECNRNKKCSDKSDCDDDDDERCIRGYCCERDGHRCKSDRHCNNDDDDDDD
ncbi:hypothetical protein FHG87_022547 [Trinorchestia longiramus]|nr:hypothetical protein FHG87_022547 [Trinorchestia longiramus]